MNPNARIPPVIHARDVLPVEEETGRDFVDIRGLLHLLWVFLLIAGLIGVLGGKFFSLGLVLIAAGMLIAILIGLVFPNVLTAEEFEAEYEPTPSADGQVVLDYARRRRHVIRQESFQVTAFISGFFSSVLVIGLVVLMMGNSKTDGEIYFGYWFLAIALLGLIIGALRLGRNPRFNGIGRGVLVGILFAIFAPFGYCFLLLATK